MNLTMKSSFARQNTGAGFHWKTWRSLRAAFGIAAAVLTLFTRFAHAALPIPLAYWNFDSISSSNTVASEPAGYDGYLVNGSTLGLADNSGPTLVPGAYGNALRFDGMNDAVAVTNTFVPPVDSNGTNFTVSCWVKVDRWLGNARLVGRRSPTHAGIWNLNVEGGGFFAFQTYSNTSITHLQSAQKIVRSKWTHLAGVYERTASGNIQRLYINGVLDVEKTSGVLNLTEQASQIVIGRHQLTGTPYDSTLEGVIDEVKIFTNALSAAEIAELVAAQPLSFTLSPATQSIQAYRPVTFNCDVAGLPSFPQWQRDNGVGGFTNIPGATEFSYTIAVATPDLDGAQFRVVADNSASTATSDVATLNITADTDAPVLLSAGSASGYTLGLRFDEVMDAQTATNSANYAVSDGMTTIAVTNAYLWDNQTVALQLNAPVVASPGSFTVTVVGAVKDASLNAISGTPSVIGYSAGFDNSALMTTTTFSEAFSYTNNVIKFKAGGKGAGGLFNTGSADDGFIVAKLVTDDFDVLLRVTDIVHVSGDMTQQRQGAGLMVRGSLAANAPQVNIMLEAPKPAGNGGLTTSRRNTTGSSPTFANSTIVNYMPDKLNDGYVRLRRLGQQVTCFYSPDGLSWSNIFNSTAVTPFADAPIYLGVAGAAADNTAGATMTATLKEFGNVFIPGASLTVSQEPLDIAIPSSTTANFNVAINATGASGDTVAYQWQRTNSATGGWTNIPDANGTAYSLIGMPSDNGSFFRVNVTYGGIFLASRAALLTVTNDFQAPTIVKVSSYGRPLETWVTFDRPVSSSTAQDAGNYTLTNSLGAAVAINSATLQPDMVTVVLSLGEAMVDGGSYALVVSNVGDLNVPSNVMGTAVVGFTHSQLVGYWQFEEGAGSATSDSSVYHADGTLLNGVTWAAGPPGAKTLSFDGVNGRVKVANAEQFKLTGSMTLSAWVYYLGAKNPAQHGRIVAKFGSTRGWGLNVEEFDATGDWAFQIASSASALKSLSVRGAGLMTNQWVHLAGVYDNSDPFGLPTMKLYTNGVLAASTDVGVPFTQFNNANDVYIGSNADASGGSYFNGKIDEVHIYSRALSDTEIADLAVLPQPLQFGTITVSSGQIYFSWTGNGQLEWAPTVLGPWTAITPAPSSPYSEAVIPGVNRFFRLNSNP